MATQLFLLLQNAGALRECYFGGVGTGGELSSVECWNSATNTWEEDPLYELPAEAGRLDVATFYSWGADPANNLGACIAGGRLIAGGATVKTVFCTDSARGGWRRMPDFPVAFAGTSFGGYSSAWSPAGLTVIVLEDGSIYSTTTSTVGNWTLELTVTYPGGTISPTRLASWGLGGKSGTMPVATGAYFTANSPTDWSFQANGPTNIPAAAQYGAVGLYLDPFFCAAGGQNATGSPVGIYCSTYTPNLFVVESAVITSSGSAMSIMYAQTHPLSGSCFTGGIINNVLSNNTYCYDGSGNFNILPADANLVQARSHHTYLRLPDISSQTVQKVRLFVTKSSPQSVTGGVAPFDALCMNEASENSISGNFRALVSTPSQDAVDLVPDRAIVRLDGGILASTKSIFFSNSLMLRPVQYADQNVSVSNALVAWTGSNRQGVHVSSCSGFTSTNGTGEVGFPLPGFQLNSASPLEHHLQRQCCGAWPCDNTAGVVLYCVEVFTEFPTQAPTTSPTKSPTTSPTTSPTKSPTTSPTKSPTTSPTKSPTTSPTKSPTTSPTKSPSTSPTTSPTVSMPYSKLFVTKGPFNPSLGVAAAADLCKNESGSGNWKAVLITSTATLSGILGTSIIVNTKGQFLASDGTSLVLATSVASNWSSSYSVLHADGTEPDPALTAWVGMGSTCSDWSASSGTGGVGFASRQNTWGTFFTHYENETYSCDVQTPSVYCVQSNPETASPTSSSPSTSPTLAPSSSPSSSSPTVAPSPAPTAAPTASPTVGLPYYRLFVTRGMFNATSGVVAANALCNSEGAVLAGGSMFRALLVTSGSLDVPALIASLATSSVINSKGQLLASNGTTLGALTRVSAYSILFADGEEPGEAVAVWIGRPGSTCSGWSSPTGSSYVGYPRSGSQFGSFFSRFNDSAWPCAPAAVTPGLYCVDDSPIVATNSPTTSTPTKSPVTSTPTAVGTTMSPTTTKSPTKNPTTKSPTKAPNKAPTKASSASTLFLGFFFAGLQVFALLI